MKTLIFYTKCYWSFNLSSPTIIFLYHLAIFWTWILWWKLKFWREVRDKIKILVCLKLASRGNLKERAYNPLYEIPRNPWNVRICLAFHFSHFFQEYEINFRSAYSLKFSLPSIFPQSKQDKENRNDYHFLSLKFSRFQTYPLEKLFKLLLPGLYKAFRSFCL